MLATVLKGGLLLEYHQRETDEKLDHILGYIVDHEESSQKVFFSGRIFDAFNLFTDIISCAEQEIILIDGYVNVDTLNILAKKKDGVTVTVYALPSAQITTNVENSTRYDKIKKIN